MRRLAALAIVPALAMVLAGCGERSPQEMAQRAIRSTQSNDRVGWVRERLDQATTKQEILALVYNCPGWADSGDAFAASIYADVRDGKKVEGIELTFHQQIAVQRRWDALPFREAVDKAKAEAKAKADTAASHAAAPVLDHRTRFTAARESGVTIATPSTPSAWTAIEGTVGRDMRGVFVAGTTAYAWGPAGGALSRDGGATWEATDTPATAGVVYGDRVVALDGDGNLINEEGFAYAPDLPRYGSIGISGGSIVVTSRTKLAYLRVDGSAMTEEAKHDRDPASFVAGYGKRYVYLAGPDGTVRAYDRERGAVDTLPLQPSGPTTVGRPPDGYRPVAAVPVPYAIGGEAAYADGGVNLLVEPRTNLVDWCAVNAGTVLFGVSPDGKQADLLGPRNERYEARTSLPPGTREVAMIGGSILVAVTTNGLWTAPAK